MISLIVAACSGDGTKIASVTGTVTEAESNKPISKAEVVIGDAQAVTDAEGRYALEKVALGDGTVDVMVGGVRVYSEPVDVSSKTLVLDIEITDGVAYAKVGGSVKDTQDNPVVGVSVRLGDVVVDTDEDGKYVFPSVLYGGHDVKVVASSVEYEKSVVVNKPELDDVNFAIPTPTNIALNKPVVASSRFSARYTPENAVDGEAFNQESRWLTGVSDDPPHWLEIDLEQPYGLDRAEIYTGDLGGNAPPGGRHPSSHFSLQYMVDGEWEDIPGASVGDNDQVHVVFRFDVPVITDKVRFYSEVTPEEIGGYSVFRVREIEVYGVPVP